MKATRIALTCFVSAIVAGVVVLFLFPLVLAVALAVMQPLIDGTLSILWVPPTLEILVPTVLFLASLWLLWKCSIWKRRYLAFFYGSCMSVFLLGMHVYGFVLYHYISAQIILEFTITILLIFALSTILTRRGPASND
ncbi:MAG: hypothetical protein LLF76_06280 [Planctomycetaceae bacterium]|nr:hypothetical protein [Planctomycetaceae bacterium]